MILQRFPVSQRISPNCQRCLPGRLSISLHCGPPLSVQPPRLSRLGPRTLAYCGPFAFKTLLVLNISLTPSPHFFRSLCNVSLSERPVLKALNETTLTPQPWLSLSHPFTPLSFCPEHRSRIAYI